MKINAHQENTLSILGIKLKLNSLFPRLILALFLVSPLPAYGANLTSPEAQAFWEEFDNNTLHLQGEAFNMVYGVTDTSTPAAIMAAQSKLRKDISAFINAADKAIRNESIEAHGGTPTEKQKKEVDDAFKKLKTSGAFQRLSDLQLKIIKKHFNKDGNIDFEKFQLATEMFANGELRAFPVRVMDMDVLGAWFRWKQFSEQAIKCNINTSEWEKLLKSLQKGIEIYKQSHPAGNPMHPFSSSTQSSFDATKQLTEQQKKDLRQAIDGLSTDDILKREKDVLRELTPSGPLAAAFQKRNIQIASMTMTPLEGGFDIGVLANVTDRSGNLVTDATLSLIASELGIVVFSDVFTTTLDNLGSGQYGTEFFYPSVPIGFSFVVVDEDESTSEVMIKSFVPTIPEPHSGLGILAIGGLGLLVSLYKQRQAVK